MRLSHLHFLILAAAILIGTVALVANVMKDSARFIPHELPPKQLPFSVPLPANLAQTTHPSEAVRINKERQGGWQDEKCQLVRRDNKGCIIIEAKSAIYDIKYENGGQHSVPVTVFCAPKSENSWVGPEQDLYIETAAGIVGLRIEETGIAFSTESLRKNASRILKSTTKLDDLTEFVENLAATDLVNAQIGVNLEDRTSRRTDLRRVVKSHWFFDKGPGSSEGGKARILGAEIEGDQVRLRLENETRQLKADVWIEIKTNEAVKGIMTHDPYDGKLPSLGAIQRR